MIRRILHFAEDSDTSGFFPQLARWHDRHRYAMFFGTLKPMAPWLREFMEQHGVRTLSCDGRSRFEYPWAAARLVRFLRREAIEILHTHLFEPSVIGLLAGLGARTPVRVLTRHYSDYHTRINKAWHVRLDRLCTRLCHAVIAVSQHTAEHLVGVENAPPEKIHTILNGIDLERIQVREAGSPARLRRQFAEDGAHLLLVAARLHPEKGYHYLFGALPELRRQMDRPVRLLVAGTGSLERVYREEVAALGCTDMVRFLGFRSDLPDLMVSVDLVVLPSLAEAFGLVAAEALALGAAVLASRVGGIPEIVEDGVDGVLVSPADSHALAEAIAQLLKDPARRQRLAAAGPGKIKARFRFEDMVRSYEALYEKLATR